MAPSTTDKRPLSMSSSPPPSSKLKVLADWLRCDADGQERRRQNEASHRRRARPLRRAIDDAWASRLFYDGSSDINDDSDVDPRLYQCPISERRTTLAQWTSLPDPVRMKVARLYKKRVEDIARGEGSDAVVEIPIELLERDFDEEAGRDESMEGICADTDAGNSHLEAMASILHREARRRRLGGNLTDKLSEYTRGVSAGGQRPRPFKPGGEATGDGEEKGTVLAGVPYFSKDAVAKSQRVLECSIDNDKVGLLKCWEDRSMLRAPLGHSDGETAVVNFTEGLSWKDLYPSDTGGEVAMDTELVSSEVLDDNHVTEREHRNASGEVSLFAVTERQSPTTALFSRAFFDDDSLFGSSSSSESEDDGHEDEEVVESTDKVSTSQRPAVDSYSHLWESKLRTEEDPVTSLTDAEEVDALLVALTETTTDSSGSTQHAKKIENASSAHASNPLVLAQRHAHEQNNPTRKMWASTKLLPIGDFEALIPNPPISFPFTLDGFQQQAVARLERSESVFVAAHTSAGKTVVAEYAVALAKQRATRCVYTSPIKALSNQKFRDFSLKFGSENVGLVTGDLQVNVDDSTCLIMTTEILRSMLYRGADLIRDIEWVIFDECHYVNDTERGVVWEEVIIMLPSQVNLIFLSATTPNTLEFSDWIGRTKRKSVYVIKTDYRPVPLQHCLWAGTKLHKILEGKGSFLEAGYRDAARALLPSSAKDPNKQKADVGRRPRSGAKELAWQSQGSKANWMSLIRFLDRELLSPTVVFSFSKKKCEEIANMLRSLDLNTAKERSAVQAFSLQTVARLSENDSKLPQVLFVCEMVQRGIGVHHGGLLPILKEMVEILFSRNLIKVLFATETFAMGVNMPARAVVFNSIRKHDGTQFRILEPGEYTQMAGRAGRRGLDSVGTVIMCCFGEEPPPQQILKQMLTGSSTRLQSQFRLTYNMILNLLRVEEMSVESMISRSFSEFATQRALTANEYPQLLSKGTKTLAKLEEQFSAGADGRVGAEDLEEYFRRCAAVHHLNKEVLSYIHDTEAASFGENVLQPGRVLLVTAARQYGYVRAPAIVLRAVTPGPSFGSLKKSADSSGRAIVCLVLMPPSYVPKDEPDAFDLKKEGTIGYIGTSQRRHYAIHELEPSNILCVSSQKHKIDPKCLLANDTDGGVRQQQLHGAFDLSRRGIDNAFAGMKSLGNKSHVGDGNGSAKGSEAVDKVVGYLVGAERTELQEGGLPILDIRTYLKRGDDAVHFRQLCDRIDDLVAEARSCASHLHPCLEKYYIELERKEALREKVGTLQHLLSNESLQLFPDFLQRKAVLQKLGYIDEHETVAVKGRVACEVNTCEELIVTEMVFEGILNDLDPEEIAAVLSALVFQGRRGEEELDSELPEKLVICCEQMKTIAVNLGQIQKERGLNVDPNEYRDGALQFGLVHVVYEWSLGVPFKNICDLTDVQEGSIVRTIVRLDELCREVRNCARVVGNPTLYRKLEAASVAIKRDIVFASSLYVS